MSAIKKTVNETRELSHEENRKEVCFIYLKKSKLMFNIENSLKINLKKLLKLNIDSLLIDDRLLCVLCVTCKRNMYCGVSENDERCVNYQNLKLPDFSNFNKKRDTRSNVKKKYKCDCYLCEIARSKIKN